ncbi:hypothetical protein ACFRFJ_16385 [Streptomyces hydrogenans]
MTIAPGGGFASRPRASRPRVFLSLDAGSLGDDLGDAEFLPEAVAEALV